MGPRIMQAMWLFAAVGVAGFGIQAHSQQPAKGPVFPPINPAVARLDQTIAGLDGPGYAIAYGEDMDLLVAACEAGTMQGWKKDVLLGIRNGTGSANALRGHQGPVLSLAWNGGKILASAGADKKIQLWSPLEGVVSKTITSDGPLNAIAMDPEGKLLAGGGEDYFVHLWDIDSAKPKGKLSEHTEWILAVAFSLDGKQLASADFGGKVVLWDVSDESKKVRELTPRPMPPPKVPPDPVRATSLAFAPDGKAIAIGSGDGIVHLVSVGDGKLIRSMPGHTSAVTGLAFHPTGTLLASSSKDRTIRLWNPQNGAAIKTLEGHEAWVEGVVFTNRGTRLASVSADQTVRMWDLTDPPKK